MADVLPPPPSSSPHTSTMVARTNSLDAASHGAHPYAHALPFRPYKSGRSAPRTSLACTSCRGSKTKCTGDRPTCMRCVQRGTACVYQPVGVARPRPPPTSSGYSTPRSATSVTATPSPQALPSLLFSPYTAPYPPSTPTLTSAPSSTGDSIHAPHPLRIVIPPLLNSVQPKKEEDSPTLSSPMLARMPNDLKDKIRVLQSEAEADLALLQHSDSGSSDGVETPPSAVESLPENVRQGIRTLQTAAEADLASLRPSSQESDEDYDNDDVQVPLSYNHPSNPHYLEDRWTSLASLPMKHNVNVSYISIAHPSSTSTTPSYTQTTFPADVVSHPSMYAGAYTAPVVAPFGYEINMPASSGGEELSPVDQFFVDTADAISSLSPDSLSPSPFSSPDEPYANLYDYELASDAAAADVYGGMELMTGAEAYDEQWVNYPVEPVH